MFCPLPPSVVKPLRAPSSLAPCLIFQLFSPDTPYSSHLKMEVLAILISLFVAGVVSLALYFRRNRGHLETLGIPIDPPMFMFGSSPWALHKVSTDNPT